MKKIKHFGLTAGLALILAACSGGANEAIVETDSGNITKEELYKELKAKHGDQVLRPMIEELVITSSYQVDENELSAEIENLKKELGDQYDDFLASNNWKEEDLEHELRVHLAKEKAYTEDIEVPEDEIKEHYDRLKEEIKAQHILVDDEKTAKEVKKKIDDGEDFNKLVSEYSKDTGTVDNDGLVDFFSAGEMDKKFEDAAYGMKKDEISDPVQSSFGFHIIKIVDRRDVKDLKPLDEMKNDIERELAIKKVDPAEAEDKIQKLIDDADIKIKDKDFEDVMKADQNMLGF